MRTRLAVIGDVHAHLPRLGVVLARVAAAEVDGILLVGDIGPNLLHGRPNFALQRRYLAGVAEVLDRVNALGKPIAWVPGNHDLPDLSMGGGSVDAGKSATIGSLRIAGIGGAGPARFGFPYEWDEPEIRRRTVPPCDVLLCHAPPLGTTLDLLAHGGGHAGSAAIRERAEAHVGALVCGHIHESPGVERLNSCLCLNAGGLGEPFGRAQVGFIEADAQGVAIVWHEDLEGGTKVELRRGGF